MFNAIGQTDRQTVKSKPNKCAVNAIELVTAEWNCERIEFPACDLSTIARVNNCELIGEPYARV